MSDVTPPPLFGTPSDIPFWHVQSSTDGQQRPDVLGVRELEGNPSGENQAKVVIAVVLDFQIATKLGIFVGDKPHQSFTSQSLSSTNVLACRREAVKALTS